LGYKEVVEKRTQLQSILKPKKQKTMMTILKKILPIVICFAFLSFATAQNNLVETHPVYFQSGTATLSESTQIKLYQLRKELAQYTADYYLEIHAHTDNVGTVEDNNLLSTQRAMKVADYLVDKGLASSLIKKFTYGENAPKSNNNSSAGRQDNRRVDIQIYTNTPNNEPRDYNISRYESKIERYSLDLIKNLKKIQDLAADNLEAEAQLFDIDPKSDTLLIGKYGTAIYIPANTFEPIADENKITISLNEIYKKSDMILTNFSTSTNGQILESGGMVHITAIDGTKEYSKPLKHDISFFFPTLDMRGDMDLYFGEADVNANVDWALSGRKISDYDGFKDPNMVDTDDYTGNYFDNLGLKKRRRIVNPESNIICINQGMTAMLASNPSPFCTETACPLFCCGLEKTFAPKIHKAKTAAKIQACLSSFLSDNNLKNSMAEGDLAELSEELQRRYGNNPEKMRAAIERKKVEIFEKAFDEEKVSIESMNFYIFSTRRLGSINCDALPNDQGPKEMLAFNLPKDVPIIDAKLVFKERNSVLNASAVRAGKLCFNNIPKGMQVILVVIDYSQPKPRLSLQEITVGKDKPQEIVFQELETVEDLKNALKKLDV
jgi:outer membrane protein OmpA-like peptidoglycan-associated protein